MLQLTSSVTLTADSPREALLLENVAALLSTNKQCRRLLNYILKDKGNLLIIMETELGTKQTKLCQYIAANFL